MQGSEGGGAPLTPDQSLGVIHTTMDRARSSMYLAGSSMILLLWGALTAVAYSFEYWLGTWATDLAEESPWVRAPFYGAFIVVGIVGSALIGSREATRNVTREVSRAVGLRVFGFWMSVAVAAWLIPAAVGLWEPGAARRIPLIVIGIVALGYILFGMMTTPMLAGIGAGIGGAYYLPHYLAGDAAYAVSAVATLLVVVLGFVWLRKSGIR